MRTRFGSVAVRTLSAASMAALAAACASAADTPSQASSTSSAMTAELPALPNMMPMRRADGTLYPKMKLAAAASAQHASVDSPLAPNNKLKYYGGPVISNAKVYEVNWGPNVNATVKAGLPGFYTAVTASAYFDWLNEYDTANVIAQDGLAGTTQHIGRGSFGGAYTITPAFTATTIDVTNMITELAAQIQAGHLPAPSLDSSGNVDSVYMFDFAPGVTLTHDGRQSCVQFCAFHGTADIGGKAVAFGVHPDMSANGPCGSGCGGSGTFMGDVTAVHSHELVESITDIAIGDVAGAMARPGAWYNSTQGEIGDICNGMTASVAGYVVQKEWSNSQGACIATNPNAPPPAPVCDGTNATNCRACTPADCTGANKVCEISGSKSGQCVQCNGDTDCTAPMVCDTTTHACVGCTTNAQCKTKTAPVCGTNETCRGCTSNAECAGNSAGGACVTSGATAGSCAACNADGDCKDPTKPKCDGTSHTCIASSSGGTDAGGGGGGTDSGGGGDVDSGGGGGGGGGGDIDAGGGGGGTPGTDAGGAGFDTATSQSSGCSIGAAANEGPFGTIAFGAFGLGLLGVAGRRRRR